MILSAMIDTDVVDDEWKEQPHILMRPSGGNIQIDFIWSQCRATIALQSPSKWIRSLRSVLKPKYHSEVFLFFFYTMIKNKTILGQMEVDV